ncbi:MAG: carboxypeptidase-like regulatory domain-containing protein [Bacteroidota bacterium]
MTTAQSNRERAGDAVKNCFIQFENDYQNSQKFKDYVNRHTANLDNVHKWSALQEDELNIIGITRSKRALRMLMVIDGEVIIGAIRALSDDPKDDELAASVNYSPTFLRTCKEGKFIAACTKIKTVANDNAAALIPHGISTQMLTNWSADLLSFINIKPKSRSGIATVATYTKNLAAAIKKMMSDMNGVITDSIKQFAAASPDFVNTFKNDKKVVDYGNTATGVHGRLTDKKTTQRLKNMVVQIVELGLLTSTNSKGMYEFLRVPMGNYTLLFRGPNYIPVEIPVMMEDGKLKVVDMEIEHVPVEVMA